jgi:WD40 repeat protein
MVSWLEGAGNDDRLLLYWSGHGIREADGLYLVTQESPAHNLNPTNAVEPRLIAKSAANSKARKILVILDACFSGEALGDVIGTISRVIGDQPPDLMRRRGIQILASAHALQKAQEGIVSGILKDVLTGSKAGRRWSDEDRFIDGDRLSASLDDEIEKRAPDQLIMPAGFGSTFELLPNPRYRPGLVAEVVEERAWRLAQSGGAEHFDLAARGIEVGESGWYFAGRTRLLRALVDWLTRAEHGVRIVTGPPGAGKSAVMGRLATLSDPQYRETAIEAGVIVPTGTILREHIIDVAIHAKGKTLDDCARALAQALGIAIGKEVILDIAGLVTSIGGIDRRVTIMVDALDEAASGQGSVIASRLIVPLGRSERVRVLVGSRRSVDGAIIPQGEERHVRLRAMFGADAIIDDLEDEAETHEDIAQYVRLRLAASPKHANRPEEIAVASERVAVRADGVFLYARIVSRTLQELDRLDGELPTTALEAFGHDLRARFGAEQQRVDDLLAALAWGEGKGLTRRVWPLVATALAAQERSYDDDDVAWVLGHAGWHIIEAGEDGHAVYRLGHQALADYYRSRFNMREAQGRIVAALTKGIAGAVWLDRDRYLWRHLADHAAQAGRLDALIRDPCYLAVADPARLVTLLPVIQDEGARRFADIYNRVADRLIDQQPLERLPLIHMTAQMEAPDLAPLLEPPVATRWLCRWAQVRRSAPHRIIGKHSAGVTAIAFGTIEGHAVVVSGSEDYTVRLWDARTGKAIGKPLKGHTGRVDAVALGAVDGRAVVVSGSQDRTIRLWEARTGEAMSKPLEGHTDSVSAAVFGVVDGRAVVVSGSWDHTICLWDARTGKRIGTPLKGHTRGVTAVALGAVDDRAVVVSGSHDHTVRLWDARTGEAISKPLKGHTMWVTAVALGMVAGRSVVVSGSWDHTIRLWDARTGKPIGKPLEGHTDNVDAVALGALDGRAVVVSGSADHTIRLWDARVGEAIGKPLEGYINWIMRLSSAFTGKQTGKPLEGHAKGVSAVALGAIDGRAVVISGSGDCTIRLWDALTGKAIGKLVDGHTDFVTAVALGVVDRRAVVISGSWDRTIRLWDARTGEAIGTPLGHTSSVVSVALGAVDGRAVVVSGSRDHTIRLWDARTRKAIGKPLKGHTDVVGAIALGAIDGRAVVVSGSGDQTIRLWDARTGKKIGKLKGHMGWVTAVALGAIDGRAIVVSGSSDKTIRLWDARTGEAIGTQLKGHTDLVHAVTLGVVEGCAVVISGSDDKTIRLWDARTGEAISKPLKGHAERVAAVALAAVDGRQVLLSGSWDGTARLWDPRTHVERLAVTVGRRVNFVDSRPDVGLVVGLQTGILALEISNNKRL